MLQLGLVLCVGLVLVGAGLAQYGDISDLKILKPEDKEDVKSVPPPTGAIVLFDGKNLDGWAKTDGKAAGRLEAAGRRHHAGQRPATSSPRRSSTATSSCTSSSACPTCPGKSGQGRGNSGVYVQGRYEVQVLDSYGLKSKNNDCGAIYGIAAPLVNACKAPTVWQSYDIEFTAPMFEDGKRRSGRG